MKKTLLLLGKTLLGFLAFIGLYLLSAYCLSSITVDAEANTKDEIPIHILTNGVHTDIVVPTHSPLFDWSSAVAYCNTIAKDSSMEYLAMGWGDKGFYLETPTWADLKASTAFRAAFGLSNTAIHATYYKQMPEGESCKKILISKEQYARLVAYIKASFQKGKNGQFIPIDTKANYGKSDAFYEANGSYSMFHTCNTWSNKALKASGQKAALWTAFDSGIFSKYE